MEEEQDRIESEQISDSFVCAVCLDLVYKPIILACGHISCFWCVHNSMSFRRESHCPICRNAYQHFPAISKMLHFLLYKIYPVTYKKRENQILEMEKKKMDFSPDLGSPTASEKLDPVSIPCQSSTISFQDNSSVNPISMGKGEACTNASHSESSSDRTVNGNCGEVSVSDVLCAACKQMLYRPVALNCGHLYCEVCIIPLDTGKLLCQVCEFPHPGGFPKVCLVLEQFLEERFPLEYVQRKGTAQLKQIQYQKESLTMEASKQGSLPSFPKDENFFQWLAENGSNFHAGVGCDSCGMVPIIGDRYKCKDCKEKIGFDLCGDCYNTRSKLPGRFNQQHTPEHRMHKVRPQQTYPMFRAYLPFVPAPPLHAPPRTPENNVSLDDVEDGTVFPDSSTDQIEDQEFPS